MKIIRRIIIIFFLLGIYSTLIEPNLIKTNTYDIEVKDLRGLSIKIVQFSDTQLGDFYSLEDLKKAVLEINSLKADIVTFTGDLIDNASKYEDINLISKVLKDIDASLGKFAVYGNHDHGGGAVRYYEDIMKEAGFTVLKNSSTTIVKNDIKINIFGVDDALLGKYDPDKTMKNIDESDMNILLMHEPDNIEDFENYPIDLALSGHSHGGQVSLPFYGPIKKNILSEKFTKGLYEIDNERETKLYVNTGLGNTKVPFRFGNIPEVSEFNIISTH